MSVNINYRWIEDQPGPNKIKEIWQNLFKVVNYWKKGYFAVDKADDGFYTRKGHGKSVV